MNLFRKLLKRNKYIHTLNKNNLPEHIAIIMDGNGRWARKKGLSRNIGHREGSQTLRRIVEACKKIGIKYLTVYAFSTENWNRPKSEVDSLMALLLEYLQRAEKELAGDNTRIRVIGDLSRLSEEIRLQTQKVMKMTEKNTGLILNIALNYGGRAEIAQAAKEIAKEVNQGKLKPSAINEKTVADRLYTAGIPDPDLIIRTGGEERLSNFLLWQAAYSELWFTDVLWPDFSEEDLLKAIKDYQERNRRYGGI
ncbi:MAG TPA: isoprenyl transferase [Clostridiaceae bacterium]|nr:isoprenyl transferase [Clostridiaceae bacterium]